MTPNKFLEWLKEETDFGDWHPNVQKEVTDKLIETYGKMTNEEYSEQARATDTKDYPSVAERVQEVHVLMMLHACMGITTECGELMDVLKKYLIYGKPIDKINVMEEDGDLRWYLSLLEFAMNFTQDESQERNIAKLKARFPNKFTEFDALNRNLEKERKILRNE